MLRQILRIQANSNQRISHNMKRLQLDMKQVRATMAQVREDVKTLELMEKRLAQELSLDTQAMQGTLAKLDTLMISWA